MSAAWKQFEAIHVVDCEFGESPLGTPSVRCLVDHDVVSGRTRSLWLDGQAGAQAPMLYGERDLVVAYYATAEASCFRALGWPRPAHVVDLFAEFRCMTNGHALVAGNGLLGALAYFGLPGMEFSHKDSMRELALRGGPYSREEQDALMAYCASDVLATTRLLDRMCGSIDLPRALVRGAYMVALADVEHVGVPVDAPVLDLIHQHRPGLQARLVESVQDVGCYEGTAFRAQRWNDWLTTRCIPWPRDENGRLRLDDDTFSEQSKKNADVRRVHYVRRTLAQLHDLKLAPRSDGRLRCMTSAFGGRTGRNQPSTSKFIFGLPAWMRGLVRPEPGRALAYVDWSSQEIGIAAALSRDEAMMQAYATDPYIGFGQRAGILPAGATKASHGALRDQLKVTCLAAQYGQGPGGLAQVLRVDRRRAAELLNLHRRTFGRFWAWSQAVVDAAQFDRRLVATFGWGLNVTSETTDRTLRNFPVQANGAEMMRLATFFAVERGVEIAAIVHDAFLVGAPDDQIESAVATVSDCMRVASALVLDGFELRSDARIVRAGGTLIEPRGIPTWELITSFLKETS